jgi:acetyl esterase
MITCQLDKLCKEGERFASMLVEAGITVTCRRFVNSLHGFTVSRTDEWEEAMELIHRFIRQRLEHI